MLHIIIPEIFLYQFFKFYYLSYSSNFTIQDIFIDLISKHLMEEVRNIQKHFRCIKYRYTEHQVYSSDDRALTSHAKGTRFL